MKVLLINGSPHENGAANTALSIVADAIREEGIEAEIFWIGNDALGGCMGCGYCRKNGSCIRNDAVNVIAKRLEEFDGYVFGSAVHYAAATGALSSFMDRLFFSSSAKMRHKPTAAVVSCRRGGASAAFDEINKYFSINQMPIVSSCYWNQIHGTNSEDVLNDTEGVRTMRVLGKNMAYLLKCIDTAKAAGIEPPQAF